ncbi:pyridoxal phosphate-dependent decarboxylase family protein [Insolitispirillum peregrinum]|uniref:L-2,4-diaminobutyrate decarboxylase n=1 Tax=Insolitispirillum peregrinum TaxID=80876 RepID=A0A1N7MYM9_9PROT|nr:pyridoxal-dependent decarboxylase [Insolitispirillum peregrinum]SIS91264.1 L-2,4-diaminobutyrate decarboxylase [Insolitispirillum peregrinum]
MQPLENVFLPVSLPASVASETHGRGCDGLAPAFGEAAFTGALAIAARKVQALLASQEIEGVRLERPHALLAAARSLMVDEAVDADGMAFDADRFADILDLYLRTGIKVNSRGYMARQFSSVVPVSAVFDLVSAIAPQPASYYEAGQLANVADKLIAEQFAPLIGWEAGTFEMVTTSGASLANMTAVLAARNRRLGQSWQQGVQPQADGRRPAIAIGGDAHFSVSRIAGVIGIGQDQVIRLPLNDRRQVHVEQAAQALEQAAARGLDVFCIVAAAGTTSIGAIDPLPELAALARKWGAWLHVDAAHNGSFLVSDNLRPRLRGLELADSFCLDAHKTLFVPALCTLLFYRDPDSAAAAFPEKASYVFDPLEDEMSLFQSGIKNFECTKRPSILNLWLVWALFGRRLFEQKLDYLVMLTELTHDYLAAQPDFAVMHRPEANILCFTHHPAGLPAERLGDLHLELRNRIRAEGRYFLSKVELDGVTVLRLVMMNHQITMDDVIDMIGEVRRHAREICADWGIAAGAAAEAEMIFSPQTMSKPC